MLTDSPYKASLPSRRRRAKEDFKKLYSDAQKIEAAKLWLVTGNLTQTAAALSIDRNTLAKWKASQWWKDLIQELRTETKLTLSHKLRSIANKALAQVEDRLDNGDWFYDQKSGELRRKPVVLRDATRVAMDMTNTALKLAEDPDVDGTSQKQVMDKLEVLKRQFEEFSKNKKVVEVVDVIFQGETNALHDQREKGLQEGKSLGREAPEWSEVS